MTASQLSQSRRFSLQELDDIKSETRPEGMTSVTDSRREHNTLKFFDHLSSGEESQISTTPPDTTGVAIGDFFKSGS